MKWYEEKPKRLKAELVLIRQIYPEAWAIKEKGRLVICYYILGRKAKYFVKVVYPDDFPFEEPRAYVVEPKITHAQHRWLEDNSLCVEGNVEPPNVSGKIIIDWSIGWLRVYENWLDGVAWPDHLRGR